MPSELTGPELDRAACEAVGWGPESWKTEDGSEIPRKYAMAFITSEMTVPEISEALSVPLVPAAWRPVSTDPAECAALKREALAQGLHYPTVIRFETDFGATCESVVLPQVFEDDMIAIGVPVDMPLGPTPEIAACRAIVEAAKPTASTEVHPLPPVPGEGR